MTDWLQQQSHRMKYPFDFAYAVPCQLCASAHPRKWTLKLDLLKHVNSPRCLQPRPLGPPLPPSGEEVSPTIQGLRNCVSPNPLSVEMISEAIMVINETICQVGRDEIDISTELRAPLSYGIKSGMEWYFCPQLLPQYSVGYEEMVEDNEHR